MKKEEKTTNFQSEKPLKRRDFLRHTLQTAAGAALAGATAILIGRASSTKLLWQIDPGLCVQCEKCSQNCVLPQSAVKTVHSLSICGYCDLCSGFLQPGAKSRDTGAENRLCPTGAIKRAFIEEPYFEYSIDESLCIGCGKCVKGCRSFGNGSLYLQVRHNLCLNCNECSIARACPAQAFKRTPARSPYILKGDEADKYSLTTPK